MWRRLKTLLSPLSFEPLLYLLLLSASICASNADG